MIKRLFIHLPHTNKSVTPSVNHTGDLRASVDLPRPLILHQILCLYLRNTANMTQMGGNPSSLARPKTALPVLQFVITVNRQIQAHKHQTHLLCSNSPTEPTAASSSPRLGCHTHQNTQLCLPVTRCSPQTCLTALLRSDKNNIVTSLLC